TEESSFEKWCRGAELNCLRRPFQGRALPVSYLGTGRSAILRGDYGGVNSDWHSNSVNLFQVQNSPTSRRRNIRRQRTNGPLFRHLLGWIDDYEYRVFSFAFTGPHCVGAAS